jgi:hypothetical protein
VVLLALPFTALAWDGCKFSAERKGGIDTTGAERVEILARAGDLTVRPAPGSALGAAGRACASRQEFLDQTQLHVRRAGNVIQVHVQTPEDMSGIGILYAYLDLQVVVPDGLPVEITDSSGDMSLDGVGIVRITDSSGDVVIRGAKSVHVPRDSSGDLVIERVSGDVRIDQDSSGDVFVTNVGGNLEFLADGSGQVRVTDVRGTTRLP